MGAQMGGILHKPGSTGGDRQHACDELVEPVVGTVTFLPSVLYV